MTEFFGYRPEEVVPWLRAVVAPILTSEVGLLYLLLHRIEVGMYKCFAVHRVHGVLLPLVGPSGPQPHHHTGLLADC